MKTKLVVLLLWFACAAEGCEHESTRDSCQTRSPSIAHGVFGCTTSTDDVGEAETEVLADFEVQVFREQPPATPEDGLTPEYSTRSDAIGFYELELPPGTYWICTTFRRCAELTIPETGAVRRDYDFGVGPGW